MLHEDAGAELHRGTDAQASPGQGLVAPQVLGSPVQGGEGLFAGLVQTASFFGEAQVPAPAGQQGHADEALQLGHGVAHGGLGAVEAVGAGGEAARLGEGEEGPQLGQVEQGIHDHEYDSCLV